MSLRYFNADMLLPGDRIPDGIVEDCEGAGPIVVVTPDRRQGPPVQPD